MTTSQLVLKRIPTIFADYGLTEETKRILSEIMPRAIFVPTGLSQPVRTGASYTPWYLVRPAGRCAGCNEQWPNEAYLVDGVCSSCCADCREPLDSIVHTDGCGDWK